jgi:hypothetical protein
VVGFYAAALLGRFERRTQAGMEGLGDEREKTIRILGGCLRGYIRASQRKTPSSRDPSELLASLRNATKRALIAL